MTTRLTVSDRQLALEGVILGHESFKEALRKLGAVGNRAFHAQELAGRARVVVGRSGSGKTQLLKALAAQPWAQPRLGGPQGDFRPLLPVEVPDTYSERALVAEVMTALGEKPPTSWSKERILDELEALFKGVGLRVLLLDEAHWMMMSDNLKVQRQAAEFLKSLMNRTGVHVILAGVGEITRLYDHEFMQTRRRMLTKVHMQPYNWSVLAGRAAFMGILKLYEKAMDYPVASGIFKLDMASRLYLVSGGELGIVVQYLSQAIEEADRRGLDCINLQALGAVHEGLRPDLDEVAVGTIETMLAEGAAVACAANPFLCTGKELEVLWAARFQPTLARADRSRQTRLKPGRSAAA